MLQYDISRSPNYIDSDIKAATITIMAVLHIPDHSTSKGSRPNV